MNKTQIIIMVAAFILGFIIMEIFIFSDKDYFSIERGLQEISADIRTLSILYIEFPEEVISNEQKRAYIAGIFTWGQSTKNIKIADKPILAISETVYKQHGKIIKTLPEKTYQTIDDIPLTDDCLPQEEGESKFCYIVFEKSDLEKAGKFKKSTNQ